MLNTNRKKKDMLLGFLGICILCLAMVCIPGPADAREELTDQEIGNAVDDQLSEDPVIPAWDLDVVTSEGIVTLTGEVNNILEKERAENIAAMVKGVRGVVNTITVNAPARSDAEIKESVERALARDPATDPEELQASVEDGRVTLAGEVDSWQEYQLAAKVAKGVKGVQALTNNVRIGYRSERSDTEIREDIEGMLHWDAFIDDALVDVAVEQGKVTLSGAVGSLAEKREAENDAWVAGVKSVDNKLEIEWWDRDERLRKDKYVDRTDAEIEEAVRDVLFYDPRVDSYKLTVESDEGYVILRGTANNLKAKRAAEDSAGTVVGVWGVDNKIKVRSQDIEDSALTAEVRNALEEDPYVDRFDVEVTSLEGTVYLLGDVDSAYEKNRAADIASRQQGVVRVKNYLTVKETPEIQSPYPEGDRYTSNWKTMTMKGDWEIKEDIEDEFFWSPFVDGDEINVQVDDGTATLTGTVDTWGERRAATENALEGGALVVDNNLKVEFGPDYYLP